MRIDDADQRLLAEIADGLPLVAHPYAAVGSALGISETEVVTRLRSLIAAGVISRFGVVVRHRELGYRANAMVAWDVPDRRVASLGRVLADYPFVTLCYERRRHLPEWPYNLFCMIHGTDRAAVEDQIAALSRDQGIENLERAVLFSKRRFKQCGARYGRPQDAWKGAA